MHDAATKAAPPGFAPGRAAMNSRGAAGLAARLAGQTIALRGSSTIEKRTLQR